VNTHILPGSFRDPSGFIFYQDGVLYRQVNEVHKNNYDFFMSSGLYQKLLADELLISHEEVGVECHQGSRAYKVIKPEPIPFISYPYEWCFSQLKEAALMMLRIQRIALDSGMSLRDASAFNIQFKGPRPIFIDTLSFEIFEEKNPWIAYRQFCRHFLAPLALMGYLDERLGQQFRTNIDGIPLDLTCAMLPLRSYFRPSILIHIYLHAKSQRRHAESNLNVHSIGCNMDKFKMLALIDSLESAIKALERKTKASFWQSYHLRRSYTSRAFEHKKEIVAQFLDEIKPRQVWDLGANTGVFSRIASRKGIYVVSFDSDHRVTDINFQESEKNTEKNILPLVMDLANPSPGIGWENAERASLNERGPADCALALALVHHLAIGNNIPFDKLARFFKNICNLLIVEFIPKRDAQTQKLLSARRDIFADYHQKGFEKAFGRYFSVIKQIPLRGSARTVYLMKRIN